MSINEIIVWLMAVFVILGAIDRILGNKFGLGESFEEGIMAMGSLALAMIGILCLAPVLAGLLRPIVVPLYSLVGADPAMFAGTILANDMGGASLAMELAETAEAGRFGGLIVGAMLTWYEIGFTAGFWKLFLFNAAWVALGEALACYVLGSILLHTLPKSQFFRSIMPSKANTKTGGEQ